jgi:hypothetical protein
MLPNNNKVLGGYQNAGFLEYEKFLFPRGYRLSADELERKTPPIVSEWFGFSDRFDFPDAE